MPREPLITIFNGRRRSLGGDGSDGVFLQLYVALREYLCLFSNSEWKCFCAIAFHINQDGWAWPSVGTLARETGLHPDTVKRALRGLCEKNIEGDRVLLRYQPRRMVIETVAQGGPGRFNSNHYLVFPTREECDHFEGMGVRHLGAATGGGYKPSLEKPTTVKPTTVKPTTEKPTTNNNHVQPEPCIVDVGICLDLLAEIGVFPHEKVRDAVGVLTVGEVERIVHHCRTAQVKNRPGLAASMVLKGIVPALEGEDGDYRRYLDSEYYADEEGEG